jgi:hypothetical protein
MPNYAGAIMTTNEIIDASGRSDIPLERRGS